MCMHTPGFKDVCADLLNEGLKPYNADANGNTPLHLAGMRGHGDVMGLLLDKADDKTKVGWRVTVQ